MELRIATILFHFILLSSMASAQEWKVFNSFNGGFSVLSPGILQEKAAIVTTSSGEVDLNTLYLSTKDDSLGNYVYIINYYDIEKGLFPKDSIDLTNIFLSNTMDQSVSDINGHIIYQNPFRFGAYTGLMWRAEYEGGAVKSRAFVINNRFYMLQVFSEKRNALNRNVDRFLESFSLRTE